MKRILLNLSIYIFIPSIIPLLVTTNTSSKEYALLMFITYVILTIYFFINYKKDIINNIKDFNIKKLFKALIIFIIGLTLMILCNYIINYIIIPNGISNNEMNARKLLNNNKIIYSILLAFLIPFIEEVIFRLEFKKHIKNKYIFLIVSSFTFSLLHIIDSSKIIELLYIIPYFVLGYTFSLIYYKENNIIYSILMHSLNNIITLIVLFI